MNPSKLVWCLSVLISLVVLMSMPAGAVSAQENSTWPIQTRLMTKGIDAEAPDDWLPVGYVEFRNSNENFVIEIFPDEPYRISNVAIHIVQDSDDFESVIDRKTGSPKPGKFAYRTDYLDDGGLPVDHHADVIPLGDFDVCWGMNPEACRPLLALVSVMLQRPQEVDGDTVWTDLPESAYAEESSAFTREDKDDRLMAWFVTYRPAKTSAGHFVDANVNGLAYATSTQSGVTTGTGITGHEGQFWYVAGERIGFSVGSLFIGETLADRQISPVELFPGADMEDDRVLNVARLLQSFDADGVVGRGAINITEPVITCLESALVSLDLLPTPSPDAFFADDGAVEELIGATIGSCAPETTLTAVTKEEALENLNSGMQAGNLMKRNISKTPAFANDKAKIEIMPVYVPAQRPDGSLVDVAYYYDSGEVMETRDVAKPIVVAYLGEVEGTDSYDTFVAISRDDGDSWKLRNISRTAGKSSLLGYPGKSEKPMLKVKDNMIFVAWTDKYCRGGRPGYAITVCPDTDGDGVADACDVCRDVRDEEGNPVLDGDGNVVQECTVDYPGDDAYWQDDLYGVAGPQRSVDYEGEDGKGEVPYSCVWTARGVIEAASGDIQWFKPERLTSGRRDAYQLFAGAGEDVAFAIVWQEDPKGLMPGEGDGPGDGWSGANTHSKTDIWYSYITMKDFAKVDPDYPLGGHGENDDIVDLDPELAGRVKALVPMSLPVKISDNDVCSAENIAAEGGSGEHEFDEEGEGTHRYCDTPELCAYTVEKANPKGEVHNVCVTADGRLLDGNTGASRANVFLLPFKDPVTQKKSAWAVIGYEESKGVGSPPEDEEGCGDEYAEPADDVDAVEDDHEDRYKPDSGKNVIYHSFRFDQPEAVAGGGILNLPETDENGAVVYLTEDPALYEPDPPPLMLDWKGDPILAYENARRIRFLPQPTSKKGASGTILVALYRQGEEGGGKPADIFMRTLKFSKNYDNPYHFGNFRAGAQNVSSVTADDLWQNPLDPEKPVKMLRWSWNPENLADSSAKNPYTDARAHRGALVGDDLIIGYTLTPNWGRRANDKYDFYVRRSFDGGQNWTTDPMGEAIEHNVVFRDPVLDEDGNPVTDEETGHLLWEDIVVTTTYGPGASEPPRNVSNLRNYRTSVLEPRLVKTPGSILTGGILLYPEDEQDISVYQLAFGLEFNQNAEPDTTVYPKKPLDILYSRTMNKGQEFESVTVTPQGGSGKPEEGWNPLAQDQPEQGAAQLRQTPDGSRLYGIWLEEGDQGSDIMFRRVDYRGAAPADPE